MVDNRRDFSVWDEGRVLLLPLLFLAEIEYVLSAGIVTFGPTLWLYYALIGQPKLVEKDENLPDIEPRFMAKNSELVRGGRHVLQMGW